MLAVIALVISIIDVVVTVVISIWSHNLSKKQIQLEQVNTELQIQGTITDAEERVRSYGIKVAENPQKDAAVKAYNSALEGFRNAYEEACNKYVCGKIDKIWFKKNYQLEIQQLVDNPEHKDFYSDITHSAYQNTIKVYREWFRDV